MTSLFVTVHDFDFVELLHRLSDSEDGGEREDDNLHDFLSMGATTIDEL